MKVYKDGNACTVDREQVKIMIASGWTLEPVVEVPVVGEPAKEVVEPIEPVVEEVPVEPVVEVEDKVPARRKKI